MVLITIIILLFFLIRNRHYKVVSVLTILQLLSIVSTYLIGEDKSIDSFPLLICILANVIYNLWFIAPWKSYDNLEFRQDISPKRIDRFYRIMVIISSFAFVVLLITSIFVILFVDNINEFKYGEENNYVEFYYTQLPFSAKFLILANTFYNVSYFLIPLHFYYLINNNQNKAFICGLLSTNIILFGLTFFSRWTILSFVSLYAIFYLIFKPQIPRLILKRELKMVSVIIIALAVAFGAISLSRFQDDSNSSLSSSVPSESVIKDPTLYSIFSYAGQAFPYGVEMIEKYRGPKFYGKYAMSSTNNFFSSFGLIPQSDFDILYQKYWPDHWWRFTGMTSITLWDFGIIFTILLAFFYNRITVAKSKYVGITQMMKAVILIQIPLTTIFYSLLPMVIFLFIVYYPISIYLRLK